MLLIPILFIITHSNSKINLAPWFNHSLINNNNNNNKIMLKKIIIHLSDQN